MLKFFRFRRATLHEATVSSSLKTDRISQSPSSTTSRYFSVGSEPSSGEPYFFLWRRNKKNVIQNKTERALIGLGWVSTLTLHHFFGSLCEFWTGFNSLCQTPVTPALYRTLDQNALVYRLLQKISLDTQSGNSDLDAGLNGSNGTSGIEKAEWPGRSELEPLQTPVTPQRDASGSGLLEVHSGNMHLKLRNSNQIRDAANPPIDFQTGKLHSNLTEVQDSTAAHTRLEQEAFLAKQVLLLQLQLHEQKVKLQQTQLNIMSMKPKYIRASKLKKINTK